MTLTDTSTKPSTNPFSPPAVANGSVQDAADCTLVEVVTVRDRIEVLLERAARSTPAAQELGAGIHVSLGRLRRMVDRADAKGSALREIAELERRQTALIERVADMDTEEALEAAELEASRPRQVEGTVDGAARAAIEAAPADLTGLHEMLGVLEIGNEAPDAEEVEDGVDADDDADQAAVEAQLDAQLARRERIEELGYSRLVRDWAWETEWARRNSHPEIKVRGRLSNTVIEAYLDAHDEQAAAHA